MKRNPTELINLVFSGVMVAVTLTGAILFLFTDFYNHRVWGKNRYILAGVFLLYAVYRSYRMNLTIKKGRQSPEEE